MKKNLLTFAAMLLTMPLVAQNDFHATWISTVANIDWPSKEAIGNTRLQQTELRQMLDSLMNLGMNAVIFQVRPTADAMYKSSLEPWSIFLTGKQGFGHMMDYDPLEFVLKEAAKRKMAVHVWLNPYRITNGFNVEDLAPEHIYFQHPEWFWKYGKQWYFEPGLDETRHWLCMVVEDILSRYRVQGIHMDDYFYPYRVAGEVFPDSACFAAHPRGFTDINEWRRNNVNMAIKEIHEVIQRVNPEVEFGISPFGIWRNQKQDPENGSETNGMTNYDDLYADILLWLKEGWIDYVCPQLYWYIGQTGEDYDVLAHWWAKHSFGKKLYIGMAAYKQKNDIEQAKWVKDKNGKKVKKEPTPWATGNEICRQLRLNRTISEIRGEVYFSTKALLANPMHTCDSLKTYYKQ